MGKWALAWSHVPIDYNTDIGILEDITQRAILRNNLNGNKIRVKFCNLYHPEDMILDRVIVMKQNKITGKRYDQADVTCHGQKKIVVNAGEAFYSDELEYPVTAEDDFVISIYFKEKTRVRTVCVTWAGQTWRASYGKGDQTERESLEETDRDAIFPFWRRISTRINLLRAFVILRCIPQIVCGRWRCLGIQLLICPFTVIP